MANGTVSTWIDCEQLFRDAPELEPIQKPASAQENLHAMPTQFLEHEFREKYAAQRLS
jgi:hypothetical protein